MSWQTPRDDGIEIRVYGVTKCIGEPAKPKPGTTGACLVGHTALPESLRTQLGAAPASDGTLSWSWTEEVGCSVGLEYDDAGPAYYSVVLAAYSSAGHSIFAIAEPGTWYEPGDNEVIC